MEQLRMTSFNSSKDEFYRRQSLGITIERCYDLQYARLISFSKCPPNLLRNFSYIKLAAAGFYFDSEQNLCKCFKCGIIWTDNHFDMHYRELMEVHRQISPYCHFVCSTTGEISSGNVNCPSIGIRRPTDVESQDEPRSEETNTKERPGTPFTSSDLLDTGYSSLTLFRPIQEEGQPSIIQSSHQCSNVEDRNDNLINTDYNVRVSSFRNWPKTQTPVELAVAGFFYTGKNDVVECFSCGLRLAEWEPHENPWMEHKKNNPECDFVKTQMPNRLTNRETYNPLTEQPSKSSEAYGAIANPTEDVATEFDNPSSRNFSTQIISDNDIDLYMGGTVAYADDELTDIEVDLRRGLTNNISHPYLATTAVLETATSPNTKKPAEINLNALYSVIRMLERDLKMTKEQIMQRDMQIAMLKNEMEKERKQKEGEVKQQYMEIERNTENHDQEIVKRDVEKENLEMQIIALTIEVEALRSNNTQICELCCTEIRNVVFLPCGHVYCCEQCAMRLQSISPGNQNAECPLCKLSIENSVKFFWS